MRDRFEDEDLREEEGIPFLTIPIIIAGLAIVISAFIFLKITMDRLNRAGEGAAANTAETVSVRTLPEAEITRITDSWYRRKGDQEPAAAASYDVLVLTEGSRSAYGKLDEALKAYSADNAAYMAAAHEENCRYSLAGDGNCRENLSYKLKRADESVFSFSVQYDESGAIGTRKGISGAAFSAKTGKRLSFGDVAAQREDFCDRAAARLFEFYGAEEFDFDSTRKLSDYLCGNILLPETDDLFTVDPLGVTVYLPAGVAAAEEKGIHTVTVFFSESPKMFKEGIRGTSDHYVMMLDQAPYLNFADLDSDGEPELITVEGLSYEAGDEEEGLYPFAGVSVALDRDENRRNFGCETFEAALVKSGSEAYIYVSVRCDEENKLLVYELKDGKAVFRSEQEDLSQRPFTAGGDGREKYRVSGDAENIPLVSVMSALGTYTGTRSYTAGKNGAPSANTDWYLCEEGHWLTAKTSLRALALDQKTLEPTGNEIVVPANAYMTFCRTDNTGYIDFFAGNTTYIRVRYGAAAPQSVNGVTAEEAFDGIER